MLEDSHHQHNYLGHGKKSFKFLPCSIGSWRCLLCTNISFPDYSEMEIFLAGDLHDFTNGRLAMSKVS